MVLLFMEDHWLLYTVSLEVFADDTDYETTDMRAVSGGAIMCGGACVCWFSRIQRCGSFSTTERQSMLPLGTQ